MAGFLAFMAGPWGAVIQKTLLVLSIVGLIYIGIHQYTNAVSEKQRIADQNVQLQQVIKDNNILNQKLDHLSDVNKDILIKLDAKNGKVIETHDKVTTYIQSPAAQKSNRDTSDVIKNTIGMLRD